MRTLHALAWLTLAQLGSLLREGLVRRSLGWPIGLVCGVLLSTVAAAALIRGDRSLSIPLNADASLVELVQQGDWPLRRDADPAEAVRSGAAFLGTDGHTLWLLANSPDAIRLESMLREAAKAPWQPEYVKKNPTTEQTGRNGRAIGKILAVLFSLYGAVIGLGGIARDREDGSLQAELVLPVPNFVPALARWAAGALLLAPFYATAITCLNAILGVEDAFGLALHGIAGAITALSLGIAMVGNASLRQSFSGPFAVVAVVVTALVTAGNQFVFLRFFPLASVGSTGSPGMPLFFALLSGPLAALIFSWRNRS